MIDETKQKISNKLKGRKKPPFSEIHRQKIREASLKQFKNGMPQQTKNKISKALKGKLPTKGNTGKKFSEEWKRKIGSANFGKKRTIEERIKISIAIKNARKQGKGLFHQTKESRRKISIARRNQILPRKDTKIEIILQQLLSKKEIKFKKHYPILGQPDIFIEPNVCIFADGDYWHKRLESEERDKKVNERLEEEGYKVLRFWEKDIRKNMNRCIKQIEDALF